MNEITDVNGWPLSNYPIFFALVLLATTAVTLSMNDEKNAEELAVYAYYFLVIGVAVRFLELSFPENSTRRIKRGWMHLMGYAARMKAKIPGETPVRIRMPAYLKKLAESRDKIAEISRNTTISLSLFFIVSVVYGLVFDWWAVRGYLFNLIWTIFGFLIVHLFAKRKI